MMTKKPYYERIKDFFLVYSWSKRWNRYICTHKFDNQRDAELTIGAKYRHAKDQN